MFGKGESKEEGGGGDDGDAYDVLMRELHFDGRKKVATERTKTAEEIIAEERERLENLEKDRKKRMMGGLEEDDKDKGDDDDDEDMESEDDDEDDDESGEDEEEEEDEDEGSDLEESDEDDMDVSFTQKKDDGKAGRKKKKALTPEEKAAMMEAASKELPFTFSVPSTYEELEGLLEGRSPSEHGTIAQRIIKCNHPQFGEGNKEKLQHLFVLLLQATHDAAAAFNDDAEDEDGLEAAQHLIPYLYDLAQFSPAAAAQAVLSVLQEKSEERARAPRAPLGLEVAVFLKLAFLLFPSSDYRHPVATPATHLAAQYLATARFASRPAIATGLLVATILTEVGRHN